LNGSDLVNTEFVTACLKVIDEAKKSGRSFGRSSAWNRPFQGSLLFDCRGAPLQVTIPHRAVQIDGRFGNSLKPIQI